MIKRGDEKFKIVTREPESHACHSGIPHVVSHKGVDEWLSVQGFAEDYKDVAAVRL